jgi:hypothetical protein
MRVHQRELVHRVVDGMDKKRAHRREIIPGSRRSIGGHLV